MVFLTWPCSRPGFPALFTTMLAMPSRHVQGIIGTNCSRRQRTSCRPTLEWQERPGPGSSRCCQSSPRWNRKSTRALPWVRTRAQIAYAYTRHPAHPRRHTHEGTTTTAHPRRHTHATRRRGPNAPCVCVHMHAPHSHQDTNGLLLPHQQHPGRVGPVHIHGLPEMLLRCAPRGRSGRGLLCRADHARHRPLHCSPQAHGQGTCPWCRAEDKHGDARDLCMGRVRERRGEGAEEEEGRQGREPQEEEPRDRALGPSGLDLANIVCLLGPRWVCEGT
mmetsp:Transcript_2665/g.5358  ORF Transcript_2665/g.5358 Transcript_2665/m.5358 type:complete len:276 (+) Transcript_2665:152-979(+)